MARTATRYRKLAKTGGLFAYYSLWQGPDHLLIAETAMASEDYRRFYFHEIQAIIVQKTGMQHVYSFLFGLPGVLALMVGTLGDTTPQPWLIFSFLAGLFLAINLFRGPTCVCHIRTAVQNVKIRPLVRMRRLNKVLDRVQPLIVEAQANLPSATPGLSVPAGASRLTRAPERGAGSASTMPVTDAVSTRLHRILFGALVIQALLAGIEFYVSNLVYGIFATLFVMGVMILTVVALARQTDSGINAAAKRFTWAALALVCLEVAAGYAASIWSYATHPELLENHWGLYEHLILLSPRDHVWLMGLSLTIIVAALGLGLGGLASLRQHRRRPTDAPDRGRLRQAAA
ncbi:MAG: hypothetical protein QNJ04_09225 [Desulfobacterales bacterium]|nr:hypothetical protein [Desulfobacterales bacterium]